MRFVRTLKAIMPRASRPQPVVEPRPVTPGLLAAKAALRESTDHLQAAIEREPEVREVAARVKEHARRNHFIELLSETLTVRRAQ